MSERMASIYCKGCGGSGRSIDGTPCVCQLEEGTAGHFYYLQYLAKARIVAELEPAVKEKHTRILDLEAALEDLARKLHATHDAGEPETFDSCAHVDCRLARFRLVRKPPK